MNRRTVLKSMGLTLGYVVANPPLLGLLRNSRQDNALVWNPVFFSPEEGAILMQLADIILPKTDTPSATEVGVHKFLDTYINEVYALQEQELIRKGLGKFIEKALNDSGKEASGGLEDSDLEPLLAASLAQREAQEEKTLLELLETYKHAVAEGRQAELDATAARYMFANQFRDAVIWVYKTSELIGKQVLAYLPVPGDYIGCGNLEELTGGKAWSF